MPLPDEPAVDEPLAEELPLRPTEKSGRPGKPAPPETVPLEPEGIPLEPEGIPLEPEGMPAEPEGIEGPDDGIPPEEDEGDDEPDGMLEPDEGMDGGELVCVCCELSQPLNTNAAIPTATSTRHGIARATLSAGALSKTLSARFALPACVLPTCCPRMSPVTTLRIRNFLANVML